VYLLVSRSNEAFADIIPQVLFYLVGTLTEAKFILLKYQKIKPELLMQYNNNNNIYARC
jgi:hypothetical protein